MCEDCKKYKKIIVSLYKKAKKPCTVCPNSELSVCEACKEELRLYEEAAEYFNIKKESR